MSTTEQDGYNSAGQKIYADFFDSATGRLVEEIGYRTDGSITVDIKHAVDGSYTAAYYDATGRLTEQDSYAAGGVQTGSLQYAADSSYVSVKFSLGKVAEIDAFSASNVPLYGNTYDPSTGALIIQRAFYSDGSTNVVINDNSDGSYNTTYYAKGGRETEYDTYNSSHLQIGSVQFSADGSYISVHFDSSGRFDRFDAYSASNVHIYANVFDPTTGRLAQQIAYGSDGNASVVINNDVSGSQTIDYYKSQRLTEHDTYAAGGAQTGSTQYAADGSYVGVEFDNLGRVAAIDAYNSSSVLLFKNKYNPATGALTEQDGYASNGVETTSIVHNDDGSLFERTFSNSGQLLTSETINTAGQPTAETSYSADGSYTTSQFANGQLVTLTGYSATGAITYANHYDANTGAIVEQDGYGANGALNYSLVHAADGTSSSQYFNSAGQLTEHDYFDTTGVETASTTINSDGSYVQRIYTGGKISSQQGYDAQGHTTFLSTYGADGSSTQTSYDSSGNVYLQNSYNASGQVTTSISPANGNITYRYGATPPNGTLSVSGLQTSFDDEFGSLNAQATHGSYWITTLANGARTYAVPGATDGEVEYYSDSSVGVNPFSITNGVLDIAARRASPGSLQSGLSWTSGVLTTYGSFTQTYGIFEMRAQLPAGSGFWPAFFLLPATGFGPPELDIMENLGGSPTTDYTSTHSYSTGSKTGLTDVVNTANLSTGFHTFAVDWEPSTITWYIDGVAVSSQATPADMNGPMYMLLNLAVGGPGSWPGAVPDSISSADELIDWVRVYQTAATKQSGFNLQGSATNNTLVGAAGDDTFTVGTGNEHIDGGGGNNTVIVGENFEASTVRRNLDGSWAVTSALGVDTIVNAPTIQFSDGVTTLAGYAATTTNSSGVVKIDTFDSSDAGFTEDIYNGSGRVLEHDVYAANGQKTLSVTHSSDGSGTTQIFTNGVLTEQDGFNTSGVTLYSNFYNSAGVITEQDGFDSTGHLTGKELYTNGVLTEQDGYSSSGVKTYSNIYNTGGTLIEQDGFDSSGHVTERIFHAGDGSSTLFDYDMTGAVTQEIDYDTSGAKLLSKAANGSGGYTIVGAQNGVTLSGSSGPDTFYGGGSSQTFAFTTGFGKDVVENFHAGTATGHDVIQIDHTLFSTFADLIAHTHDVNGSAVITFDATDTITLAGVQTSSLVSADFHII